MFKEINLEKLLKTSNSWTFVFKIFVGNSLMAMYSVCGDVVVA